MTETQALEDESDLTPSPPPFKRKRISFHGFGWFYHIPKGSEYPIEENLFEAPFEIILSQSFLECAQQLSPQQQRHLAKLLIHQIKEIDVKKNNVENWPDNWTHTLYARLELNPITPHISAPHYYFHVAVDSVIRDITVDAVLKRVYITNSIIKIG